MKISRLLTLTMILAVSITANAQKPAKKADQAFAKFAYTEAAKQYKLAEPIVKNLDDKARIFFQIGECHRLNAQNAMALEWYDKAITAQYNAINPEVHYNNAQCLANLDRWDDAIAQLNKYTAKGGDKSKANTLMNACKEMADKKAGKQKFVIENMAELNSAYFDFAIEYSAKKGEQVIFSSSRQASEGTGIDPITGENCYDLFYADVDKKGKMGTPQPLSGGANTSKHEGAMCFNKDFSQMFFTSCNCDIQLPSGCDVMVSKKNGDKWDTGEKVNLIDRNLDDTSSVGQPYMTPDSKYLLFVSDMPGGKGGRDIWYSSYDKKSDSWGKPMNLAGVNTAGDDMFPFVNADGSLYFSSNGRNGLGGLDIYKADKTGDITFGTPVAVPYPINSTSDDFALILDDKKEGDKSFSGFFTSNRPGGKGMDDLYRFSEPPLEFGLVGTAYDKDSGSPLSGAAVVVTGSDGSNFKLTTDGNGGFALDKTQIKPELNYTVDISKDKFIGTGDKFSTVNLKSSTNFAREYFLIPILDKVATYDMPLVLFEYNQTTLIVDNEVNSQDSLNYLLELLQKNPKLAIQLEAHTDARGEDKYNQTLSEGRAKTCVDYLISKGIDKGRLTPVGKGESDPRTLKSAVNNIPKGTVLTEKYIMALPADKQEAAHTLNRRTIFRITNSNYVPKK